MDNPCTETRYVQIFSTGVFLDGIACIPAEAKGLVVFVHGSGSSRHSARNQYVAMMLQEAGLATLLFDLLTPEEENIDQQTHQLRFDIDLLSRRTIGALHWLGMQPYARGMQIGLFGSSTGAAAALVAAAELPDAVETVVSRGGRPDLAIPMLTHVHAATLLVVGGEDEIVIDLNRDALAQMQTEVEKKLVIVPGATHLFEEPGTLEYVSRLARDWFHEHLSPVGVR